MRVFDYIKEPEKLLTPEIVQMIGKIHEHKGKQEIFLEANIDELKTLLEVALIQSTGASNRIEGIYTTDKRLEELVSQKAEPRNRSEQEISGYREVLSTIHESYEYIVPRPNIILQLHRDLYSYAGSGGEYKNADNVIAETDAEGHQKARFIPVPAFQTAEAMDELCRQFLEAWNTDKIDRLLLIPMFILDFLCIHPFNDGNGRMSRLLTLLMLYQNGYVVGQYISIEKAIAETKDEYYAALAQADQHWHEEENDPTPFIKYMLAVICSCYQDFEQRVDLVGGGQKRVTAYERVRSYAMERLGAFTKQEAAEACPGFGTSSIESALKKLTEEGVLERIGAGRKTQYVRR